MDYREYMELLEETKKMCLFGAGSFGRDEGYLFVKNMLSLEQKVEFFCDNDLCEGITVVDQVKAISLPYLYEHSDDTVCIMMGKRVCRESEGQLKQHGLKTYALDKDDIFRLCDQIMQRKDKALMTRMQKFLKERKYEFQIETSSFCNAQCVFCSNPSLKRMKSIMKQEVFEKIIERIKSEHINVSTFILHLNGEPLTDPELFHRVKMLKTEFPESKVRFTSNFALATEGMINQIFDSGLDEIICSLNSINAEKYKEIMGLDYEKTVHNIECLLKRKEERKSDLEVSLSIVAAEEDAEDVKRFKERWKEVKVRVMRLGKWIDKEAPQNVYVHSRDGICPILYKTVNILSNGDYSLCCFDSEGMIGQNIMTTSIKDAWSAKVFEDIRKWQMYHGRTNSECADCSF